MQRVTGGRGMKMVNPYFLMAGLYAVLAALSAVDASLASLSLLPWFSGLRWLRVHLITLGLVTQAAFGLLPLLAAARADRPRPAVRWDIWLALNLGLPVLLVGIPLVNAVLIFTGGSLILYAGLGLVLDLRSTRPQPKSRAGSSGRAFYLAGLGFLLLGIIVGTGLWLGWGEALRMARPKEVHLHANLWGFTSLLFAGLIVDLYPGFAGRALAWPRSVLAIFWLMVLGALALVLGPWLDALLLTGTGMVSLWLGTAWLVANVVVPLVGVDHWRAPGIWHVVTAYAWLLAPLLLGPLVAAGLVQVPGASAEQNAPQALVYGWLLQFAFAVVPYALRRFLLPADEPARLGGSWLSLAAVHAGVIILVLSIFDESNHALLHGTAYAFWAAALVPAGLELWRVLHAGLARLEQRTALQSEDGITQSP
jgi:cytochrome c oxidase cbb3-type subunit I